MDKLLKIDHLNMENLQLVIVNMAGLIQKMLSSQLMTEVQTLHQSIQKIPNMQ